MYPPCRAAGKRRLSSISLYQRIEGKAISLFSLSRGEMVLLDGQACRRRRWLPMERLALPLAGGRQKGQGHCMVPLALLTSQTLPLRRDSLRSRGEMRGPTGTSGAPRAHPMIEAELFAGQRRTPRTSGHALLCAASYARKIQGNKASKNLPDARNRAPVTPVSLHISDVSAQRKVRSQKGTGNHTWCPVPSCSRR